MSIVEVVIVYIMCVNSLYEYDIRKDIENIWYLREYDDSYKHDKNDEYDNNEHNHSYDSKYSIDDLTNEISMLNNKLKI